MGFRRTRITVLAVTALLVLGGCSEEAREGIADAIGGAASDAESVVDDVVEEVTDEEEAAPTEEEAEPTEEEPAPEPTSEEPTSEEPVEDEPAGEESSSSVPWVPLLIGVAVVALLVWAISAARRRHAATVARRDRLRDAALAETDWLLGVARERAASVDAVARARDVRLRLDRLSDSLQQLRSTGSQQVAALATDLQTSARQLADALVARFDDIALGRGEGSSLDVEQLTSRVQAERDALATELGRRPGT